MAFEPIETQEAFDAAIKERLDRQRKQFSDYDELKEKAEKFDALGIDEKGLKELQEENERLKGEASEAKAKKEREDLVSKVAKETGVSKEVVASLSGTDEESLTAQAKAIAESFREPSAPDLSQAGKHANDDKADPDDMRSFVNSLFSNE